MVIFVIIFGLIGLKIEIMVTIVATSFIGSFAAIRGLSLLIGGFPDVTKIFDLIEQKEWDQLAEMTKSASLLHIVAWVALGLFGVYFQCKRDDGKKIRRKEKDDDYKKMNDEKK